jgi:3-dehydroquinate dehydratase-2
VARKVVILVKDDIAEAVLAALGGRSNVLTNTVCMTRLRVTLEDPQIVDYERLTDVQGVLGTVTRGRNGLEVVFGPRMIDGIYHAFIRLTGIAAGTDALFPMSRQESNMRVQINTSKPKAANVSSSLPGDEPAPQPASVTHTASAAIEAPLMDEDDISVLEDFLGSSSSTASASRTDKPSGSPSVLVINGPNLNMLGIREPDLYGKADFAALLELCKEAATEAGFKRCDCYQSNHEGDLVDRIQQAYFDGADGIIINPGAYTHTSIALLDAVNAVKLPTVEVHISAVEEREDFRQVSYIRQACIATITGCGTDGYLMAVDKLLEAQNEA